MTAEAKALEIAWNLVSQRNRYKFDQGANESDEAFEVRQLKMVQETGQLASTILNSLRTPV